MYAMFRNCFKLQSLDFSHICVNDAYMDYLFTNCISLNTIMLNRYFIFTDMCSLPAGSWQAETTGRTISSEAFWDNDENILWGSPTQETETWHLIPSDPEWLTWPSIHLPSSLREIESEAFANINSNLVIYIPDSVTSISPDSLDLLSDYKRVLVLSEQCPVLEWIISWNHLNCQIVIQN